VTVAVGFVGLGDMGSVLAGNLVATGHDVTTHDIAGPRRNPDGARFVDDIATLAQRCDIAVLSLPDGTVSAAVTEDIIATADRTVGLVIDTSTVGLDASRRVAGTLAAAGIGYVDAPVSGGAAGARARTLAVMYAGSAGACAAAEPVLAGLSDRRYRVGDHPGMAQASSSPTTSCRRPRSPRRARRSPSAPRSASTWRRCSRC
jgi:3-hydroxyisobutyrate dehydrogenase